MAYDAKCEELARYFLAGEVVDGSGIQKMAQGIQDCIENLIDSVRAEREQSGGER